MLKVSVALTSLLLLTACAPDTVHTTMSPTLDVKFPGSMTTTPAALPGQRIALRFPEMYLRGVGWSLAAWNGQGWEVRYYLMSGRGSDSPTPGWWSAEEGESAWIAVGLVGPGPDYVMVPSTAPRGTYRLCKALSNDGACALLTIGTTPISRMLGDSGKGATWFG